MNRTSLITTRQAKLYSKSGLVHSETGTSAHILTNRAAIMY